MEELQEDVLNPLESPAENNSQPEQIDLAYELSSVENSEVLNPLEDERSYSNPQYQSSYWDFNKYVSQELGLEDGKFLTGSEDNPIEKDISELSEPQKIRLLKEYWSSSPAPQQDNQLTPEIKVIVDMLQEGRLEELQEHLDAEIGRPVPMQMPDEDDLLRWKITSDNPYYSEDEIEDEMNLIKDSNRYDQKIQAIQGQYRNALAQQQYIQDQEKYNLASQEYGQIQQALIDSVRNLRDLGGFELSDDDDDIRNEALSDLLEYNNGSDLPRFMEYINTPQGMAEAAVTIISMPKIHSYIETLLQRIEELEGTKDAYIENRGDDWETELEDPLDPLGLNRR